MNVPLELAKLFKACQNPAGYTPLLGTVTALPKLKVELGSRIILTGKHLKIAEHIDLFRQDEHGRYVRLGHELILLPCPGDGLGMNLYMVIGVI